MRLNLNLFASGVAALVALCASTLQPAFAQDAAAKFAEFAPKMTAQNMAAEGQVCEMETAQLGWMNYCLQDAAKSADLRAESIRLTADALAGDYPVATKGWLLHILGWIGDDSCVDAIVPFLTSDEPALFDESARALAQISTQKSFQALRDAQAAAKDDAKKLAIASYLNSRMIDISPKVETELPQALSYYLPDADFATYMNGFDALSADDQARALGALRVRKSKEFVGLVVSALASDSDEVKRAAILALEKIATAKEFGALYGAFAFDRRLATVAMKNVPGADFDAAVVAALKAETNPENLATLADVVSGRYLTDEISTLLDAAKKDDCSVRLALLSAAERLATKDHIGDFVDAFLAIPAGGDRDRAEQIIARLCKSDATPVVAKMTNENGAQIFPLLGRVGGPQALAQIERGLNASNPQVVALSVRSLCNWPDATVWKELLAAAQNEAYPEALRIQALRAFVRVVSLPDDQDGIDMSGKDKLANLKIAFESATRDDERNFVLERVGAVREPESVEFALQFVDVEKLANKALGAILDLAHQDYLRKANKDLFVKALDVVLEKGDAAQKDRAGNYKSAMN